MFITAVCIRPIGTDLVAVSAFDTLARKMGYSGSLLSLSREEVWILDLGLDCGQADELTKMLVEKTGIFVNPNTHTHVIVGPDEMMPHGRQRGREELGIAVWSLEDPQIGPITVAVRERMGVQSLKELRRVVVWWPRFAAGGRMEGESGGECIWNSTNRGDGTRNRSEIRGKSDESKSESIGGVEASVRGDKTATGGRTTRGIAESMVATRSRKKGLLANPHYQCWCIVEGGLRPEELVRTMDETERNTERFREECGVFGACGVKQAAELAFFGLYSLQHRGQESAGIVSSDGKCIHAHKGLGLVSDVLTADALKRLPGQLAIGHNRYSTTGRTTLENAQPLVVTYQGGRLAVAHNGNLVNARELKAEMETQGSIFQTTMDSEVIVHLIARSKAITLEEKLIDALSQLRGAYALIVMTETKLIGVCDPFGFRPLSIGRVASGYCLASETCAFDIIGGKYVRPVEAGEMVVMEAESMKSLSALKSTRKAHCIFELIYFSRPDSIVFSESVDKVRRNLGRTLAREAPADADIVIAVPDSSNSAALGFAEGSGLPFELGLIRNHYVGRTFIDPVQRVRDQAVRVKFNPVREILSGKRVVVVDDSIVRGTTSKKLIRLIRDAGAKAIHFRVGSPPIKNPCFYGIDTPSKQELIASSHSVGETAQFLEVDSLAYLSMEGLKSCVSAPDDFCYACFGECYPVAVDIQGHKLALERDTSGAHGGTSVCNS